VRQASTLIGHDIVLLVKRQMTPLSAIDWIAGFLQQIEAQFLPTRADQEHITL